MMAGQVQSFVFAGHSLGGTAAFCLAGMYPNTRSISFNGGAVATNPVVAGPGPGRSTFYHVAGDLISTHMAPEAATVLRYEVGGKIEFNVTGAHSSGNLILPARLISPDEEQVAWDRWRLKTSGWIATILGFLGFLVFVKKSNVPIPGSSAWYEYKLRS